MTDDEKKKFLTAVGYLDSVYAQLTNFKSRGARASKAAAEWSKGPSSSPFIKTVATALPKMMKTVPGSIKAYNELQKYAYDKKTLDKVALADAKAYARKIAARFLATDTAATTVHGAFLKFHKEVGMISYGVNTDLQAIGKSYIPNFLHYFPVFKVQLNKL